MNNYLFLSLLFFLFILFCGCSDLNKVGRAPEQVSTPLPHASTTPTVPKVQETPLNSPSPQPVVTPSEEQAQEHSGQGIPGLCSSEQECKEYCLEHDDECRAFCNQNHESKTCLEMAKEGLGEADKNVAIPGKCSGLVECGAFCSQNPDSCGEFCATNPGNPVCRMGPGMSRGEQQGQPPVLRISTMFIDLDKVQMISKFRSCQGHLVVPGDGSEPRSTMKHYFKVKPELIGTDNKVAVYAPFKGYIFDLATDRCRRPEGPCYGGGEIGILPIESMDNFRPEDTWAFSVIHIKPLATLKLHEVVEQGQLLGYGDFVGGNENYNTVDFVISKQAGEHRVIDGYSSPYAALDSLFNYLDDNVWLQFKAHGINSKEELFFSREYRQAHECRYEGSGPYFWSGYQNNPSEWVELH